MLLITKKKEKDLPNSRVCLGSMDYPLMCFLLLVTNLLKKTRHVFFFSVIIHLKCYVARKKKSHPVIQLLNNCLQGRVLPHMVRNHFIYCTPTKITQAVNGCQTACVLL